MITFAIYLQWLLWADPTVFQNFKEEINFLKLKLNTFMIFCGCMMFSKTLKINDLHCETTKK